MRILGPAVYTLLLLCGQAPAAAAPASRDSLVDYLRRDQVQLRRFVLDNGMVCLVKEDHSAPVVAVQTWLAAGAVHEGERLGAGLSHYMEHMIFKGTDTRGPAEVSRELSAAGGKVNAYTAADRTVFHTVLPSRNWRVGVDVLADAMMNASLPEDEWVREKEVVMREIAMGKDDPARILWKLLNQTAYRVHPYRVPVIGYEDILTRMTREDLVEYYENKYVPQSMVTVVAGDVDGDEVEAVLRETFKDFSRRPLAPVVLPEEPPQVAPRFARATGNYQVSRLEMAFHTTPLVHADTPALDVLAVAAGRGRSSRLVRKLQEEQKLVFEVSAWSYTPAHPGLFVVSATFNPELEDQVIEAVRAEVYSWGEVPFSDEAVEKARRQILVSELSALQTADGQASSYASGEVHAGDPAYGIRYLAAVEALEPGDLARAARTYLSPDNETLVLLTPDTPAPGAAGKAEARAETSVTRVTLSNGVPLVVREDRRLPFVDICAALKGGLLAEDEKNNGVSHLMADLLTRGTDRMTSEQMALEVESRGGSLTSFSGWNSFGLQARSLSGDADLFMRLLSECLLTPSFPAEELARQKDIQLAAIAQEEEEPMTLALQSLKGMLFPDHPYRLETRGSVEAVASLTREQVLAQHRRLTGADNLVLAVFGDISVQAATELAERHLAGLPARAEARPAGELARPRLPARSSREEPKEQAIVLVGYPGVAVNDPRTDALNIIQEAVSGLASDLFIEVRDKRGLVYYVGAMERAGVDPGFFSFYAGTRPDAVDEVLSLVQTEATRLVEEGLRDGEFRRAQEQVIADHDISLQNNSELAMGCALDELYGLGYDYRFNVEARIRALTPEKVRSIAAEILQPSKCAVSLLLPETTQEVSRQ